MSVAAQSTYSSQLPALARALAPCAKSAVEVTIVQSTAYVRFTPKCGNLLTVLSAVYPGPMDSDIRRALSGQVVGRCAMTVQPVNEEWKVTSLGGCDQ